MDDIEIAKAFWEYKITPVLEVVSGVYLGGNTSKNLSVKEYMDTVILIRQYVMDTSNSIERASKHFGCKRARPLEASNLKSVICLGLYTYLKSCVSNLCVELRKKLMEARVPLADFAGYFENYLKATGIIKNMSVFLTKVYIEPEKLKCFNELEISRPSNVLPFEQMFINEWRLHCHDHLLDEIRTHCLTSMFNERKGEIVDRSSVSTVMKAFSLIDRISPQYFLENFVIHYLSEMTAYYNNECDIYLLLPAREFVKLAESSIRYEMDSLYDHLNPYREKFSDNLLTIFVRDNIDHLKQNFKAMVYEDCFEDMKAFYYLLSKIVGGIDQTAEVYEEYLYTLGKSIIDEKTQAYKSKADIRKTTELIESLIDLHRKYFEINITCFDDSLEFTRSLQQAFRRFINVKIGVFSIPEVLNFYIDSLMKGGQKLTEAEIDDQFDHAVQILRHIDDKDYFYNSYKRALSRRLIEGKYNEHLESSFVQKLKMSDGESFSGSIEVMYNDVRNSEDRMTIFKDYLSEASGSVPSFFNALVLHSAHWPLSRKSEVHIPTELVQPIDDFSSFYMKTNNRRKLLWCHDYGNVTLVHHCVDGRGRKKRVQLVVSPIQATMLLLFDNNEVRSFREIQEATGLSADGLKYSISPLIYKTPFPLLKKTNETIKELISKDNPQTIHEDDTFELCNFPKIEKPIVKYKPGTAQAQEAESKELVEEMKMKRNTYMDMTLVRIMKGRKQMLMQELIKESVDQLIKWFVPKPRDLKGRIEFLIEREYMKRKDDDPKTLEYLA